MNTSFTYLDRNEKYEIIEIITSIKSQNKEYYIQIENDKKIICSYFGYLTFEYLSSIPKVEINKYPNIKRHLNELERRYGVITNDLPKGSILQRVKPPLENRAYKYLTLEDWRNTMLRFNNNNNNKEFPCFNRRGGITQHSKEFEKAVEERPEYFHPFLMEIISTEGIADEYIAEGLSGMEKAKYEPDKFQHLYKKSIQRIKDLNALMQVIWLTNYLHKNDLVDEEIFDFLSYLTINHEHPDRFLTNKIKNQEYSNTVRGAALAEVIKCYYKKIFSEKIFNTVMLAADDPILSVRLCAFNNMAFLMHLNKEKTLQVFLAFTNDRNEENIYKYSLNTAQYLSRYNFEALIPYFKNALAYESLIEHLAIILAIAWLLEQEGSYKLLQQALDKSDKAKSKMIDVAIKNFIGTDEATKKKCYDLFYMFLNNDVKEIVQEYNGAFLHEMEPSHFKEYIQLIDKFHTSKVAKREPHYYFDFLVKCSKQYPVECIDLISNYSIYDKPNSINGPHYDGSEPVKIVVGALNGLYEAETKNYDYINRAMNLFDEMLKDPTFRGSAFDLINKI